MRRQPSFTLQGALKILGHHNRPRLDRLDRLLGGVILGAGALALGGSGLAIVAALWGWVDQKNEATGLARDLLDGLSDRVRGVSAHERHDLLVAAHTTIVIAAFFEAYRQQIGDAEYARLKLTQEEQATLTLDQQSSLRHLLNDLYRADYPAPPGRGFSETIGDVRLRMIQLRHRLAHFLVGLADQPSTPLDSAFVDLAVERYRSHFLTLAATVPEFYVWASLGEHPATRKEIRRTSVQILTALDAHEGALVRVEELLRLGSTDQRGPRNDLRAAVSRAHRGALADRIVPAELMRSDEKLSFPKVHDCFVEPAYRLAGEGARLADEDWWPTQPRFEDLDLFLTGRLMSPDGTVVPLLLLGHPGAGKSLLTRVLAARLPASEYTVVRVPLREVDTRAPIHEQIQQALDAATHGRVSWSQLAEESGDTLRVVLLDGLDELLQAAGHRSGYLQEVMEFQRREAEQERPVAVIVTSRTVVADRVTLPRGTTVIKLEPFSEDQTSRWLHVWNRCNDQAISRGEVRGLDPKTALRHPDLAAQPLLLLMLALYVSDVNAPALDENVSMADLYRRLLESFAWREVHKAPAEEVGGDIEGAVRDQLWRLSVAAFAMFNRGRQNVTDEELGKDLQALNEEPSGDLRTAELGRKLIGQFFFVHTAQARVREDETLRCYEFMHATFGEFLLASLVMDTLEDTAGSGYVGRRGSREPSDDLLHALLSHQPLSSRGNTLDFAAQLIAVFEPERRARILSVLEALIPATSRRHGSDRYAHYQPTSLDRVREIATYSANLVLLRALLAPEEPLRLERLWPDNPLAQWRSMVALWRAGLSADGCYSVLAGLKYGDSGVTAMPERAALPSYLVESIAAMLIGDADAEARARYGYALHDMLLYSTPESSWSTVTWSWLVQILVGPNDGSVGMLLLDPPDSVEPKEIQRVLDALGLVLRLRADDWPAETFQPLLDWIFTLPGSEHIAPEGLAELAVAHPGLRDQFPQLLAAVQGRPVPTITLPWRGTGRPSVARIVEGGYVIVHSRPY